MKPVEVRAQIKAGQTGPLYLLTGDDPQSRHDLAMECTAVVDEGLQAFNVESFYANEAGSAGARDQMIAAILAHIYIGTIGMEGAFDAMGSGEVDLNWAREHHSLWVADEMKKGHVHTGKLQPAE